jgi:leucyl-tRNA synthetase
MFDDVPYDHAAIEAKWQRRWAEQRTFAVPEASDRPPYYMLEMFPYPSGKLHMGHVRNYSIGDVVARLKRARGFDVLHPMGWDAFGLPAEQAAIKHGTHPARWTRSNIEFMRGQLKSLGLSYDWDRELATCDPDYYRWEQLVFTKLLEKGLAYKKTALVNWSETSGVLANEQVVDGRDWRTGEPVVQKELAQWYLRITDYAQELLDGLAGLEGWPHAVKSQQEAWIGRSVGAEIRFAVEGVETDGPLVVFTTRPDTLYGCTFLSLAPEHPWTRLLARGTAQEAEVSAFVDEMGTTEKADRMDDAAEKRGVFVGRWATNPVNGRRVPIYTANFVLADYGTGAVMAVPAHDQRDFEFASKYGIEKVVVIQPEGEALDPSAMTEAYTGEGTMVASGRHDGVGNVDGKAAVIAELEELGAGQATINFRLRDWLVSRQRYWGCPVPVIYCEACGTVPVPEADLPVTLPEDVDFDVRDPRSPLARTESFVNTTCPRCGAAAKRDTDTFDTFMESSWYFLRYCSPGFPGGMVEPGAGKRFLPVSQYIGGIEHAVMHLLYARFYTKALRDLGAVSVDEPFENLLCQGMVCHASYKADGEWIYPEEVAAAQEAGRSVEVGRVEKMSKSKKNTVDPQAMIERYGADTARLFLMFAAPPHKDIEWSDSGVEGGYRFLSRIWRLVTRRLDELGAAGPLPPERDAGSEALVRLVHKTIARVTDDAERRMQLNTAIAAIMELLNGITAFDADQGEPRALDGGEIATLRFAVETLLQLLSPFAPHLCDELWERLGRDGMLEDVLWPEHDPAMLVEDTVTLAVQVKGKLRGTLEVAADLPQAEIEALALALPGVQKWLGDAPPRRVIHVPGRLVNVVPG